MAQIIIVYKNMHKLPWKTETKKPSIQLYILTLDMANECSSVLLFVSVAASGGSS